MRVRILSDLHQEFGITEIPEAHADLIVLAGDISTKTNALPWIRKFCGQTPAAYLCGNHEYYGAKFPRVAEKLRSELADSHIRFLENDHFELGGWHIYGCTLWTDLELFGSWEDGANEAREWMNDYKRIRNSDQSFRKLQPRDTRATHLLSVAKLGTFFETHDPAKTVVITHHAPSLKSLPEAKRKNPISCAYASNLDSFIEKHQPHLWIHGHIHRSADYQIGRTRIVSNPQGYPDDPNPDFIPDWVIDLDADP